nr:hypothetical protein [Tanacetum cinerariifolium]
PSVTIAQLGVSNQDYPSKDLNMEPTTPTLDDLALSLFKVYTGSSKIGSGPGRIDKALSDFEDQFETFSGLLASLPEDLKQLLWGYLSRTPSHHCQYYSEGINIPMTED